jgi:hypothetical protein
MIKATLLSRSLSLIVLIEELPQHCKFVMGRFESRLYGYLFSH